MTKKKTEITDFTEAQLADVRKAALDSGFVAFTNAEGRTIYLNEDLKSGETGVDIVLLDSDCIWLDRYIHNRDESIKAEADGTVSTITELLATMKISNHILAAPKVPL